MLRVFVWTDDDPCHVLLLKPLVQQILNHYDLALAWGCLQDHAYLLEDLDVRLIPVSNSTGQVIDWAKHCPSGYLPFPLRLFNGNGDKIPDWSEGVREFNRSAAEKGLPLRLSGRQTPMVPLKHREVWVRNDAVYVENGGREEISDVRFFAETFRGLNFYCAHNPGFQAHNVLDCSGFDLAVLSSISSQCDAILGTGGAAFVCTMTEANRHKPRALLGRTGGGDRPWGDTPGNPLRILRTRDDVLQFLVEVERAPKLSLLESNRFRP
jgi:hypothetical protein